MLIALHSIFGLTHWSVYNIPIIIIVLALFCSLWFAHSRVLSKEFDIAIV